MSGGGAARRDATTATLLEAAVRELVEVGQADFAMESVARRAFFSVGSMYERWPDKWALIADVCAGPAVEMIEGIVESAESLDALAVVLFERRSSRPILTLLGECLLAGQASAEVRPAAERLWLRFVEILRTRMGPGMAWYVATLAMGGALLELMDVSGPPADAGMTTFIVDAVQAEGDDAGGLGARSVEVPGVDVPRVPDPSRDDAIAVALIDAARILLAERGVEATGTRDIAATAGVTTGALYRRYPGKDQLLADVLLAQLQPERYEWTWELISAFGSAHPYAESSRVLTERIVATAEDTAAQQVLLQIGVAARNEPSLREQVRTRVGVAMSARRQMAEQLAAVGLVRGDVDAGVFAWGFQALPIGMRASVPLMGELPTDLVRASMRAVLMSAAAR